MSMTVGQVKELLKQADAHELAALEQALEADARQGVQQALAACRRRLAMQAAEEARIAALYEFDRAHGAASGLVVGLDEVGRGAVAGPLAVGAVVLPANPRIPLLNDSKQLTPQQRERVAEQVRECSLAWTVFYVEPRDIDERGMSACLRSAFRGALDGIEQKGIHPNVVLVDGNPLHVDDREVNVVKGDASSAAIAAASIVAKVQRDALMVSLSLDYPEYGFAAHKGYASAEHIEAIHEHGLSSIHRRTFCRSFLQSTLF